MTSHWKNDICSRNCRKNYRVNHLTSNPLGTGLPNIDSQLINNDIHFFVFYSQYRVKITVPFSKRIFYIINVSCGNLDNVPILGVIIFRRIGNARNRDTTGDRGGGERSISLTFSISFSLGFSQK